mgnify:FL=1
MNWKSSNVYYLAGIGIPLASAALLGAKIAVPRPWLAAVILAGGICLLRMLTLKTLALPRPLHEYGALTPLDLELPRDYGVELCTSPELGRYDFALRVAELISPMRFRGSRPKVAVNPVLLEKYGKQFMRIAIVREIERYRRKCQPAVILQLVLPPLVLLNAILCVFAFRIPVEQRLGPFLFQVVLPFALTLCFLGHLLLWNKRISRQDFRLDSFLTTVFPMEDVKNYIALVEEMERGMEKKPHQGLNDYYASARLRNLEKLCKP